MGLKEVAGIFSREFVVGYFLPAFFALVLLSTITTQSLQDAAYGDLSRGAQIAVLGGVALLGGLLLSGLHYSILRILEGYPLYRRRTRWYARSLYELFMRSTYRRFDALTALMAQPQPSPARTSAAQEIARYYPASRGELLPTKLGNVIRSFERHPRLRWGLNGVIAWPRLELLLAEHQLNLQTTAKTDVAFFVNCAVVVTVASAAACVDWIANSSLPAISVFLFAIPIVLVTMAYRAAILAALRWGDSVRATYDMYRLELYRRLGVRVPKTHSEEIAVARAVNRCLEFAEPLPDSIREIPAMPAQ
jgi:hypothetical protein